MSLVPPCFRCSVLVVCLAPARSMLRPRPCPCPGPGPCTPPIHPASSCSQRRWGVLGCGSGYSPHASRPCRASLPHASGPIVPSSLSLVLPISTPRAVAHGGGSGCCCAGRRGRHSATGRGQRRRGGVTGAYLAGIPLQGSPSALRMPFIVCTSSSFVPHRRSVLRSLSYVVRTLSYAVRLRLYIVVVCMSLFVCRCRLVLCTLSYIVHCPSYVVVRCCCTLYVVHMSSYAVRLCTLSYIVRRPLYVVPVAMYLEI
jgi:hypothetical protein